MTPFRKQKIGQAIRQAGYNPGDFKLNILTDDRFELIYKNLENYKFILAPNPSHIYMSPGSKGETAEAILWGYTFEDNLTLMKNWITNLHINITADDPWSEVENIQQEKIKIGDDSQTPLTEDERNFIDEKLDIILEALKEFATDFDRIKSDLEYLKYAGGSVSKKDLGMMVMGNVMGWAMSNAIHKDALHDVWNIIVQNLGSQNLIA